MDLNNKKKWYNRIWIISKFLWLKIGLITIYWDIVNFFRFRNQMKTLEKDPNSKFNQYNLHLNSLGNIVYKMFDMGPERRDTFDELHKRNYMIDVSTPSHSYIADELGWGVYIITNFVDFTDPETNKLAGAFGVTYKYTSIALNNKKIYLYLLFYLLLFFIIFLLTKKWIWIGITYLISLI